MINFDTDKYGYPLNRTSFSYGGDSISSEVEMGKPSAFKFTDQSILNSGVRFIFKNKVTLDEFMGFYGDVSLHRWTRWFNLPLTWNVDSGRTTRLCECNFGGVAPTVTKNGKLFLVDANILVRNPHKDTMVFYNAYLPLVNLKDPIDKLLNRLEIFSNSDLPSNL